jgi:hypothetical protein
VTTASKRWLPERIEPPTLYEVSDEEAMLGYKLVDCPDCYGCGLIPWLPWDAIEECVVCKGTGNIYINV